jgi:hypothetical protein
VGLEIVVKKEFAMLEAKKADILNPQNCRQLYDEMIASCGVSSVVTYGCSKNETATDVSDRGGLYSYNLLDAAYEWAGVETPRAWLSIVGVHNNAEPKVITLSGDRQHPQITRPRSGNYFPFVVVA